MKIKQINIKPFLIKIAPFIIFLIFIKCNQSLDETKINPNAKVSFQVHYYKDSPNVYCYGWVNVDNEKIGRWSYFNKSGRLTQTFEYKIINGERHTNQGWVYRNSINDTNWNRSIFYKISGLKTKYKAGDSLKLKISTRKILNDWTTIFYYGDDIDDDFSNLKNIKLDSFVTKDTFAYFTKPFLKKGWNNFRSIIEQYVYKNKNDTMVKIMRRMYIDEKYFVE